MPIYNGKVSVIKTRTNKVALVQDSEGAFELPKDTNKLYKTCISLAKEHKLDINIFTPDGTTQDRELLVMARRGYQTNPLTRPYFAFLKSSNSSTSESNKPVKLA
jgi:hypothetical protein